MIDAVSMPEHIREAVLEYARSEYPNEMLLLLRGKVKKETAFIESLVIPPFVRGSNNRVYFNRMALPADRSLVGSIHSHPSGVAMPSTEDLLYGYGPVIMIIGYPDEIMAFDKSGKMLKVIFTGNTRL
ncbi:MAG: Mov34/MPN/PAD-1 family protein [Nitrososphaeria archaeon]